MIENTTDIVCDTGPIIHLDELGCLDLLADFKEILLTVSVVEEIEKHRAVALRVKLPFRVLRAHHPAQTESRKSSTFEIFMNIALRK
jgi:predicted nucleic acid-binding protein